MRSVTYSMGVSLDGYIVGPDGRFDWTAPDEEVFRFVTDEIQAVGVHLLGRRLYETMLYSHLRFGSRLPPPPRGSLAEHGRGGPARLIRNGR
jgi:dihydrofolate reductase